MGQTPSSSNQSWLASVEWEPIPWYAFGLLLIKLEDNWRFLAKLLWIFLFFIYIDSIACSLYGAGLSCRPLSSKNSYVLIFREVARYRYIGQEALNKIFFWSIMWLHILIVGTCVHHILANNYHLLTCSTTSSFMYISLKAECDWQIFTIAQHRSDF